jgi:hypothetical protein
MMVTGDGGLPVGFGRLAMKKKQVFFFLAMMMIGEGGLLAAAFSIFFWFCVLFWCFVFTSSFCIFFKMPMCHVVIGGQKTHIFCHTRIAAALERKYHAFFLFSFFK